MCFLFLRIKPHGVIRFCKRCCCGDARLLRAILHDPADVGFVRNKALEFVLYGRELLNHGIRHSGFEVAISLAFKFRFGFRQRFAGEGRVNRQQVGYAGLVFGVIANLAVGIRDRAPYLGTDCSKERRDALLSGWKRAA